MRLLRVVHHVLTAVWLRPMIQRQRCKAPPSLPAFQMTTHGDQNSHVNKEGFPQPKVGQA